MITLAGKKAVIMDLSWPFDLKINQFLPNTTLEKHPRALGCNKRFIDLADLVSRSDEKKLDVVRVPG